MCVRVCVRVCVSVSQGSKNRGGVRNTHLLREAVAAQVEHLQRGERRLHPGDVLAVRARGMQRRHQLDDGFVREVVAAQVEMRQPVQRQVVVK